MGRWGGEAKEIHGGGMKMGRRSKGDTWWWNEDVKEALSWKKDAHKAMFQINLTCRKCEGNIGEAVEQEKKVV